VATRALEWPARRLLITAVDAESGEFATFGADSGVGLVDAVAAIGRNVLDPARRAPAARARHAQAESVLDRVAAVWAG
jgi:hypothetical protein